MAAHMTLRRRACLAGIILLLLSPCIVGAQTTFSDSSHLKDPRYLEERVKNISDRDLFASLDVDRTGLGQVRQAAAREDYTGAYALWGEYWNAKVQPRLVTQSYRMLIDTDMLTDPDGFLHYLSQHPEERDSILTLAGSLLQNEIRTWTATLVKFGPVVDFNRDVGQSGRYGFHYWFWSRPLNSAFIMTHEQKYLEKFDELFSQWYEQRNSVTRGFANLDVVYYELGLGVRNRSFIEYYLLPYSKRGVQTHERMLKTMLAAGRWLYELERWEGYRAGNWQIHGSYMLVQLALVFPEFRESNGWLETGIQRLVEHMEQDFYPDGGHSERAPRNYTLATYLSYRNLSYLLSAYKVRPEVAAEIHRSMGKTIDWWITMLAPTGEVPAINDSHRGLFPIVVLEDGAASFGKPEVYGVLRELLGTPASAYAVLPSYTSRNMPASGFAVMRTGWTRDALYMNLNYGKFAGFHTHNDMLDFEVYAYGKALAVDAGIGLTYDDPLYVPWYQSSRAHNMVVVNDRNLERKEVSGENVEWSSTASVDYFSGEQAGYESVGVHQLRRVAFVKPYYWVILDDLSCKKGGDTLSWYFHSPIELMAVGTGFRSTKAPGIVVMPAVTGLSSRRGTGMAASTVDAAPGKTQEINWIRFDQTTAMDSVRQFAVLLYPFRKAAPVISFRRRSKQKMEVGTDMFTDALYFPAGTYRDGEVETDAKFVCIRAVSGMERKYALANGTYLRFGGREVWRSEVVSSVEGLLK